MDNWTVSPAAGDASAILGSAWESPVFDNASFCTRTSAFFTAPASGSYGFWMTADDYAKLRVTFINVRAVSAGSRPLMMGCAASSTP